ncbi:MAG: ABC transporter permease [Spirochaetes bacterium]|nr:ABC transporter permease [Spirochaetota bacterium]
MSNQLQDENKRTIGSVVSGIFRDYGIIVAFILLCTILAFASPYFLRTRNIINVLRQSSVIGLLGIGMTFVILTGGIDLSVGSVLAFGGIISASFASQYFGGTAAPAGFALLAALVGGALLGSVNGFLIARWRVPAFVVTLGMLSIARGLTFIYTDGMPVPNVTDSFQAFGQAYFLGLPMPVIIVAGVFVIAWIVLYKTRFGRYVYAVGGNETSARISGVNTRLIIFFVYVISGLLSALGGVILTARTTAGLPQAGVAYELDTIAVVVIGGTSLAGGQGTLIGTLFGALIVGVINNGLDLLGVSAYYQQVIQGAIIIAAVGLDALRKRQS